MAIPGSGQLALSTIRDEFGAGTTSNVSLRTLSAAAGLSVPDGFNEFYGLSAYTPFSYTSGADSVSGAGTVSNPYIITDSLTTTTAVDDQVFFDGSCDSVSRLYYKVSRGTIGIQFNAQQAGSHKVSVQITTWNNNSQANCPLSQAALTFTPYFSLYQYKSSSGSTRGTDQLLNNVYTATANNVSVGQYVFLDAYISQCYLEEVQRCTTEFQYAEETYGVCSSSLSTTAFTVKVWFEPV